MSEIAPFHGLLEKQDVSIDCQTRSSGLLWVCCVVVTTGLEQPKHMLNFTSVNPTPKIMHHRTLAFRVASEQPFKMLQMPSMRGLAALDMPRASKSP